MNTQSPAAGFVAAFAEFWAAPSPLRLSELLHPEVVLRQPLAPPTVGIAQAQMQFERFCRCLPDLHARVDHWSSNQDVVFIEFTLYASLGRDALEWPTVNRLILQDGKAIERVTYFDPVAVLPTLLRHPSVWWRWAKPRRGAGRNSPCQCSFRHGCSMRRWRSALRRTEATVAGRQAMGAAPEASLLEWWLGGRDKLNSITRPRR
jgi:hypothetical protein